MKTRINQLVAAVIFSIVFFAGTVGANGAASPLGETKGSVYGTNNETSLKVENWMMNEYIWNASAFLNYEEDADGTLELENWMIMPFDSTAENLMEVEMETELSVEDWMTNEFNWSNTSFFEVETELELKVESWMTNDNTWKFNISIDISQEKEETLAIEGWMLNEQVWNK